MEVGPVIQASEMGKAIAESIAELNPGVTIVDRGSYLRVLAPGRCTLSKKALEQRMGSTFRLPIDLEVVMASYRGKMKISEDSVEWLEPEKIL